MPDYESMNPKQLQAELNKIYKEFRFLEDEDKTNLYRIEEIVRELTKKEMEG